MAPKTKNYTIPGGSWEQCRDRVRQLFQRISTLDTPIMETSGGGVISKDEDPTSDTFGQLTLVYNTDQFDESPAGTFHLQHFDMSGTVIEVDRQVEIVRATTPQLKLSYDGVDNTTFAVDNDGNLTINPSGTTVYISAEVDLGGSGITANIGSFGNVFVSGSLDFGVNEITDGTMIGDWDFETGNLTTTGTVFLGLIDLGTNTIDDGTMSGDWNFGSGNLTTTGVGTFENVVATTRVTAGLEIGIGIANPANSLDIVQRVPTIRQECVRDQPGDVSLAYDMFKAIVTNDTTSINAGRIGNFGDVNLGATPSMRYIYIDADTTASSSSAMLKVGKNGVGIGISGSTIPGYTLDMDGHLRMRGDNNYLSIGGSILDFRLTSDGTNGIIDVGTALRIGNIVTNYCEVDNVGNVTLVGTGRTLETPKIKLTAIGGYAIRLTNKTGGNTVAGQLVAVYLATAVDDAFKTAAANDDGVIGIVLDAGVADGSEAWIIVSGIADVLMDGGGSARGDRLISSATAGSADVWNVGGAVATHFLEIGHCIETRVGAGLARCVLHFN